MPFGARRHGGRSRVVLPPTVTTGRAAQPPPLARPRRSRGRPGRYHRSVGVLLVAGLIAGACTGGPSGTPETADPDAEQPAASDAPQDPATDPGRPGSEPDAEPEPDTASDEGTIEGKFDVGGHELYLRCEGTSDPTIIYLHGSIEDPGVVPHRNGRAFQARLGGDHRVCVYDRRNLGLSDTVDAVQLPEDALTDLDNLLAAADVAPPYVLLGASFGGVLAYLYAHRHPDDVVGLVLLDSMFPDEMALEERFPPEERYEAFDEEDENELLERLSHFKVMLAAEQHIGDEPSVPLIYLASQQDRRDEPHVPGYNEEIHQLLQGFVDRFARGELIWVDAPHFLEPAAPDEIEAALRQVTASAGDT
jgi:pimeloyl-ACP methyl ester carboxylesterase